MPLIIDTYNVLHVVGVLPPDLAGIDTSGLIRLISGSRYRQEKISLICDGIPHEQAPTSHAGPIIIKYSGSNRTADDVIHDLINRSSTPRRLLVISSDHEILRSARRRRCRSLTSERFLQHLINDADSGSDPKLSQRPAGTLSPRQTKQWTDEFVIDDSILEQEIPDLPRFPSTASQAVTKEEADQGTSKPPDQVQAPDSEIREVGSLPPDVLREAEEMLDGESDPSKRGASPESPPDATGE